MKQRLEHPDEWIWFTQHDILCSKKNLVLALNSFRSSEEGGGAIIIKILFWAQPIQSDIAVQPTPKQQGIEILVTVKSQRNVIHKEGSETWVIPS